MYAHIVRCYLVLSCKITFFVRVPYVQAIDRNYTVSAMNGKEVFLVEVIAMILKSLKQRLLYSRQSSALPSGYTVDDFDWVITVPAMWKARGKQMMREAAYKVRDQKCVCSLSA